MKATLLVLWATVFTGAWLSPLVGASHWIAVPMGLPDAVDECLEPRALWTDEDGEITRRRITAICPNAFGVTTRMMRTPERPGRYTLRIQLRNGEDVVVETHPRSTQVWSIAAYLPFLLLVFLLLTGATHLLGPSRPRRLRLLVGGVLLASAFLWLPLLLGGHALFLAALIGISHYARRPELNPTTFLRRASCALVVFGELYWGFVVNGSFWTAPVFSLSLLYVIYRGLRRVVTQPERQAFVVWLGAMALSVLYVVVHIYKAFFLDFPALSALSQSGQVGQVFDSVVKVFRSTHALALLLPLFVLMLTGTLARRQPRSPADSGTV